MAKRTPEERLLGGLNKRGPTPAHCPELGPCWIWTGPLNHDGYGRASFGGKLLFAHRLAFTLWVGPVPLVPKRLCVLHRCDNRPCCNPSHLFLGTRRDNNADRDAKGRQVATTKTHCKRGHEFTPENTLWENGWKKCRACHRERQTARYRALHGPPAPNHNAAKTRCKRGHPFNAANTIVIPSRPDLPKGGRACRACKRERAHERSLAASSAGRR